MHTLYGVFMLYRTLFLTVALLCSSAVAMAGEPTDFVKAKTSEVTSILSKKESKSRAKKLDSVIQKTIDFEALAARSLKGYWEKRTEDERKEFLSLLQQLLQSNYEKKLSGKTLEKDYTIKYLSEAQRGDVAIVKTSIKHKGESKPVSYKLQKSGKAWIAYDIVIDDISLEETYRESYTEIIKQEGWPALIQRMKDKVKQIKAAK